ncbi:MAG: cytochrome c biogenesis protein CcsA [Bacteroidetes bacterium]|nr:cytochrome c biogenesis protein CcsA [Bacteroidota bacterium]
MKKILNLLLGRKSALVYILLFALAIAVATFIENDFGTDSAQKVIYKTLWFEVLLALFGLSILYNMIEMRLFQRRMWSVACFHLAILVIIAGAAVTRYFGYEGMMHIREASSSNSFLSSETYLKLNFEKDGQIYPIEEPVLWSSLGANNFNESYQIGADIIEVNLKQCLVNPEYSMQEVANGSAILKLVFGGANGRKEYFLMYGTSANYGGVPFYFGPGTKAGFFSIGLGVDGQPMVYSDQDYRYQRMADRQQFSIPKDSVAGLALRSLYQWGTASFVFGDYLPSAQLDRRQGALKIESASTIGLLFEVRKGDQTQELYLEGRKAFLGQEEFLNFDGLHLSISYGAKLRELPFSLFLHDFEMERYPGTNSPASYASEVSLQDSRTATAFDFRIFMNNILNYDGYRFFQSSYDRDEKGTYLSVNNDYWGSLLSYIGYGLLTLGMLWTLVSGNSRFAMLRKQVKALRAKRAAIILLLFSIALPMQAQKKLESELRAVDAVHAELFSTVLVQDVRGRMKPMHTLSREVIRKLMGKESYRGLDADQLLLSVWADNQAWYAEAMIKLPHHPKFESLGFEDDYQAYKAFFNPDGSYKLSAEVQAANAVIDKEKGTWEKALLKLDEKVNIFNMMLSGYLLKVVPLEEDINNTWVSAYAHGEQSSIVADKLFPAYKEALKRGLENGDFKLANEIILELMKYQNAQSPELLPSDGQRSLEILLNKLKVFNRLALINILLGLGFLALLFIQIFRPRASYLKAHQILFGAMALAFILHTIGLGLRWYVSGRAPWSNGYESMIYIAWTSSLAGLLFSRKSSGALAATNVLSGLVLIIAMLSYLNPEITPLVPVLRSYWLTIHVSLEAGSYGFLMLGALIGIINLMLMIFLSPNNKSRIKDTVSEMTKLSEMTLIGGLFMLSIGTYLGGVWANESWGRYWGWDAKETWALVSILVYAFLLHMRFVPGLRGLFAFNFASLFGLASIIMTYYGVNYYLSGLHSYAAGDPVPVPAWVYYSVAGLICISALAWFRQRKIWRTS